MIRFIFAAALIAPLPAFAADQCWPSEPCRLNADAWGCPMLGALNDLTYAEITGNQAAVKLIAKTDSCRRFKKGTVFEYVDMAAATYKLSKAGKTVFIYMKYVE